MGSAGSAGAISVLSEPRPRQRSRHRARSGSRGYLRTVASTAAANALVMGLVTVSGLLLARLLGPSGRGSYAAVSAYLNTAAIIGEVGLTAAICFHVARRPAEAADYVRTSQVTMLALGGATALIGVIVAPLLFGSSSDTVLPFRVAFLAAPLLFVAAVWVFTLQGLQLSFWNWARLVQPLAYVTLIVGIAWAGHISVLTSVVALIASVGVQAVVAALLCRRRLASRGRWRRELLSPLFRYGASNVLSTTPFLVNSRLDQLVLAVVVPAAELGHYAVAVSLTLVSFPVAVAFGYVAMPRLAARYGCGDAALPAIRRIALLGSALVGGLTATVLCVAAPFVVPALLGGSFREVIPLLWVLAPGSVALGCNKVMGDLLRGCNRSLAVARCEGTGAVVTVALLFALVPRLGVMGAAIASSTAYGLAFLLLFRAVNAAETSVSAEAGGLADSGRAVEAGESGPAPSRAPAGGIREPRAREEML